MCLGAAWITQRERFWRKEHLAESSQLLLQDLWVPQHTSERWKSITRTPHIPLQKTELRPSDAHSTGITNAAPCAMLCGHKTIRFPFPTLVSVTGTSSPVARPSHSAGARPWFGLGGPMQDLPGGTGYSAATRTHVALFRDVPRARGRSAECEGPGRVQPSPHTHELPAGAAPRRMPAGEGLSGGRGAPHAAGSTPVRPATEKAPRRAPYRSPASRSKATTAKPGKATDATSATLKATPRRAAPAPRRQRVAAAAHLTWSCWNSSSSSRHSPRHRSSCSLMVRG